MVAPNVAEKHAQAAEQQIGKHAAEKHVQRQLPLQHLQDVLEPYQFGGQKASHSR